MRLLSCLFCAVLLISACSSNHTDSNNSDTEITGDSSAGDSDSDSSASEFPSCSEEEGTGIEVDDICFIDYGIDSEYGYKAYLAASETGGSNPPENAIDGYAVWSTRWEISGSQWIELRLPEIETINRVGLSFMKGDQYPFIFKITVSVDRTDWTTVYDGQSSGETSKTEYYYLDTAVNVNHIRVELNGNTSNTMNYLQEIRWGNRSEPNSYPQSSTTPSSACSYYNTDPSAISGQIMLSTFEDGTPDPDVGDTLINTEGGSSVAVVDNPFSDSCNGSTKVLQINSVSNGSSKTRAEYHNSPRASLDEETHIYTWKVYFPENFLDGVENISWMSFSQWKTWPCGWYDAPSSSQAPSDSPIDYTQVQYDQFICESAGIFNTILATMNQATN